MENQASQKGKVNSFVDESEHFGAFYDREENVFPKRDKGSLTDIGVENLRKKVKVNNSAKLCSNFKGAELNQETNDDLHHVPSTPPQSEPRCSAASPDEAKVPNSTQLDLQDKTEQLQNRHIKKLPKTFGNLQKSKTNLENHDLLRKTLEKDKASDENQKLKSNKACEAYQDTHKTLNEVDSDGSVDLCQLTCSVDRDGSDGNTYMRSLTIDSNTDDSDNETHLGTITRGIDEDNNGDDVDGDLAGDEESCDITMLKNLQSVMKQFNQKYLQQHVSTSASGYTATKQPDRDTLITGTELLEASESDCLSRISKKNNDEEKDVKRSCSEETSCILQTSSSVKEDKTKDVLVLLPKESQACQENQHVYHDKILSVSKDNSEDKAPVIVDTAVATLSSHLDSKSPSEVATPSNTTPSINPQFRFSNISMLGNILMDNRTVSCITEASGQRYTNDSSKAQPSETTSVVPLSYDPGSMVVNVLHVPYMMMLMSGAISPGLSVPVYSSVYPVYVQASRTPLSLTASQNNASQICTLQQLPTSSYHCAQRSSSSSDSTSSCSTSQLFLPSASVCTNTSTKFTLPYSSVQNPGVTTTTCNTSPQTTVESSSNDNPQCDNGSSSVECQISSGHSSSVISSSSLTVCAAATPTNLSTPDVCSSKSRDSDITTTTSASNGIAVILSTLPTSNAQESVVLREQIPTSSHVSSLSSSTTTLTSASYETADVSKDVSPNTIATQTCASAKEDALPQLMSLHTEHTFKTPKRVPPYQDLSSRPSSETSQKNSTMIRMSPRYSDTKGCYPPLVLVSKNLAPLQPIRGQAQQYVITQGHDKRVLQERNGRPNDSADRASNTKHPIYLKGTPPQGYKRRLLGRSGSKKHRPTRPPMTRKFVLFEDFGQQTKQGIDVFSKKDLKSTRSNTDSRLDPKIDYLRGQIDIDAIATEVLQEITEVISESRDVTAAQVSSPSARLDQTTLSECLREFLSSPGDTPTIATTATDNKSSPNTPKTPKRRQHTKKPSQKMSKDFRRPKTPKMEDKRRKRERDHQNCVDLRECMQKLSRILPGTQRSWSRLRLLTHALDYMEKTIKRLEGFGVKCSDICKGRSSSLPQATSSDNKPENEVEYRETTDQIVVQQLAEATSSPMEQPSDKYNLINVSELPITTESDAKGRWINLCDITTVLRNSTRVPLEDCSAHVSSVVETPCSVEDSSVYLVEVTDDSTLLTPLECTSIIDQALTLSNITQQDQLSACQVNLAEQTCPSVDNSSDIQECCQGLLALQNQQVPNVQQDIHHEVGANLNCTVSPYGYNNISSPECSPVISQHRTNDHLVNSPRLTELLASPVVVIPQDTYASDDHRFPDTTVTGMSPFIVPSSPDVSSVLRGISNPIATEEYSQSSNSQDDSACTPCGVMSDDPLGYVSPFTTPRLGFSPTFAELSPGRIVLDNECCQHESPFQRAPNITVCSVTDFSEVGLTSVAASVEICSNSEQHQVTPKRRYRKRQPKVQHDSANELPAKKPRKYQPKTPRDSSTNKKPKSSYKTSGKQARETGDTNQTETPVPEPVHVLTQGHDSFKTPSPRVRKGKLKRVVTPVAALPRKQAKIKKDPKPTKSECKRQLIDS